MSTAEQGAGAKLQHQWAMGCFGVISSCSSSKNRALRLDTNKDRSLSVHHKQHNSSELNKMTQKTRWSLPERASDAQRFSLLFRRATVLHISQWRCPRGGVGRASWTVVPRNNQRFQRSSRGRFGLTWASRWKSSTISRKVQLLLRLYSLGRKVQPTFCSLFFLIPSLRPRKCACQVWWISWNDVDLITTTWASQAAVSTDKFSESAEISNGGKANRRQAHSQGDTERYLFALRPNFIAFQALSLAFTLKIAPIARMSWKMLQAVYWHSMNRRMANKLIPMHQTLDNERKAIPMFRGIIFSVSFFRLVVFTLTQPAYTCPHCPRHPAFQKGAISLFAGLLKGVIVLRGESLLSGSKSRPISEVEWSEKTRRSSVTLFRRALSGFLRGEKKGIKSGGAAMESTPLVYGDLPRGIWASFLRFFRVCESPAPAWRGQGSHLWCKNALTSFSRVLFQDTTSPLGFLQRVSHSSKGLPSMGAGFDSQATKLGRGFAAGTQGGWSFSFQIGKVVCHLLWLLRAWDSKK